MGEPRPAESLRGLTGAGGSKVGVDKAMRARDVSREPATPRAGEVPRDGARDDRTAQDDGETYSGDGPGSSGSSPDVS
jgi:hypothetical protein